MSTAARVLLGLALTVASAQASTADVRYELAIGGRTRSYVVHPPPRGNGPWPLVLSLHGGGGNAHASAEQTGFDDEADRSGFIAVHPEGTGAPRPLLHALGKGFLLTWNAGTCCGFAKEHEVDDVAFIRAVVSDVEQRFPVDEKRIYTAGISNGAMMSYRLACEASDVFAAIGVVAGAQTTSPCRPSRPVSVIHIHGTADENVPVMGGVGRKAFDRAPKPPIENAIRFWAAFDGCRDTAAHQERQGGDAHLRGLRAGHRSRARAHRRRRAFLARRSTDARASRSAELRAIRHDPDLAVLRRPSPLIRPRRIRAGGQCPPMSIPPRA